MDPFGEIGDEPLPLLEVVEEEDGRDYDEDIQKDIEEFGESLSSD